VAAPPLTDKTTTPAALIQAVPVHQIGLVIVVSKNCCPT
jgi:hypothetical protein